MSVVEQSHEQQRAAQAYSIQFAQSVPDVLLELAEFLNADVNLVAEVLGMSPGALHAHLRDRNLSVYEMVLFGRMLDLPILTLVRHVHARALEGLSE